MPNTRKRHAKSGQKESIKKLRNGRLVANVNNNIETEEEATESQGSQPLNESKAKGKDKKTKSKIKGDRLGSQSTQNSEASQTGKANQSKVGKARELNSSTTQAEFQEDGD